MLNPEDEAKEVRRKVESRRRYIMLMIVLRGVDGSEVKVASQVDVLYSTTAV